MATTADGSTVATLVWAGVAIDVSMTIRYGHFRVDWIRTGGRSAAEVRLAGRGTLGSTASARTSSANKVPPTNRK